MDVDSTQRRWNAKARADALAESGALSATQVEKMRAFQTADPGTVAVRWLEEGRVFSVDGPGGPLFPAFQFSQGELRPVVAEVLSALADALRGWEILAWFTGSNGHLGGARPVDRLDAAPAAVVAAAAYQAGLSED